MEYRSERNVLTENGSVHRRPGRSALFLLALLLLLATPGLAQEFPSIRTQVAGVDGRAPVEYVEGEVIVRFREGVTEERLQRFREEMDVRASRRVARSELYHLHLDAGLADELIARRQDHPDLEYLQPNYIYRLIDPVEQDSSPADAGVMQEEGLFPDDPEFYRQWGLYNDGQPYRGLLQGTPGADISALPAWEITTGSEDVIVAVFDTGIDYEHPDLAANMFRDNLGRYGADCSPSGMSAGVCGDDPMDSHGHGTHVAGIIGAVGNNATGVAGVNWNVRLMAVKIFSEDPNNPGEEVTTTSSILAGYDYALANGARISNHSYGGCTNDTAQRLKIEQAAVQEHLVVAAAGNEGNRCNGNGDNDVTSIYPASYDVDNVIAVAATDADDQLAWFSNFGAGSVHIAAPGEHIYSTFPNNDYRYQSGTSMATPHVAGVAGLILSIFPESSHLEVRDLLLEEGGDRLAALEGRIEGARRLNAYRSLPAAGLQFVLASLDPRAEQVEIEVNGRAIAEGVRYRQTTELIRVPAGVDLAISVISSNPLDAGDPLVSSQELFPRDRNFRMVVTGSTESSSTTSSLQMEYHEILEKDVSADEVEIIFYNGIEDLPSVGLFGFYSDQRPPFVVTKGLDQGLFLEDFRIRANEFEIDLTYGPDRLDTFRFPMSELGGASLLAVATGRGSGVEREFLLSSGAGMGVTAEKVTPAGGVARHMPDRFELEENFPNPFREITSLQFTLPDARDVRLEVYDLLGRRVQTLLDEWLPAGIHRVEFDGRSLSSGLYLYRVRAGDDVLSGRMMLVR